MIARRPEIDIAEEWATHRAAELRGAMILVPLIGLPWAAVAALVWWVAR